MKWAWGAGRSSREPEPHLLARGELPNLPEPETTKLPQLGLISGSPSAIAVAQRHRARRGRTGSDPAKGMKSGGSTALPQAWRGTRWGHCPSSSTAGNIIEWTRTELPAASVYNSAMRSGKHVNVVAHMHAIYRFTNDGNALQTIGTPTVSVPMPPLQPPDVHGLGVRRRFYGPWIRGTRVASSTGRQVPPGFRRRVNPAATKASGYMNNAQCRG
jgi:hypothetical protein